MHGWLLEYRNVHLSGHACTSLCSWGQLQPIRDLSCLIQHIPAVPWPHPAPAPCSLSCASWRNGELSLPSLLLGDLCMQPGSHRAGEVSTAFTTYSCSTSALLSSGERGNTLWCSKLQLGEYAYPHSSFFCYPLGLTVQPHLSDPVHSRYFWPFTHEAITLTIFLAFSPLGKGAVLFPLYFTYFLFGVWP